MSSSPPAPDAAAIVAVGDELLGGAHPDLNSPHIAARLGEFGRRATAVFVVGDDELQIAEAVDRAAAVGRVVFVSGGLGPTLDDVTRHGVARALGDELVESPEEWAGILAHFERAGRTCSETNRRQALLPSRGTAVPNAFGTAPGFRGEHPSGATVFVLPGPPRELQGVFEAEVAPWLAAHPVDELHRAKAVVTFADLPESTFAEAAGQWMARDARPLVGVTVKDGILTATCRAVAATEAEARALADGRAAEIRALFPELCLGGEIASLGQFVGGELVRMGVPFTVAESCTGGAVAAALTDAPGISALLERAFVTYANGAKREVLGVPPEILEAHGAVSGPCAEAMARGALERVPGARVAVSVTGIAGPGGGTEHKPVGLVWFGLAWRDAGGEPRARAVEKRWPPLGRERVRRWARNKAMALLLEVARELQDA